jgi:hypothetical protein
MQDKILFLVTMGNIRVITWARNREDAKNQAHAWIGWEKDNYTVSPLTNEGDRIHLNITLQV